MENVLNRWKNSLAPKGSARFFQVFPWVWLIAAYCITFAVLALYGRPYIDSDMSSEMVLANLLNEEGKLLTTSWWYSTEIKFCSLQMFYQIGLRIFPHDWYAARMVGQALLVFVLLVAYLYVGHGLKLKNCGVWGAAALACPFGIWYLWYCYFGGYYIAYMIWVLLSLGAILHLVYPTGRKNEILQGMILIVSCMVSGLNSVKGLMVFYLPMFLTALISFFLRWREQPQQIPKRELRLVALSTGAILIAGIGYGINSTVFANTYNFLNYNELKWAPLNFNTLLKSWSAFLALFGYLGGDDFLTPNVKLFSFDGILSALGIVTAAAIILSLIRLLINWRGLKETRLVAPLLFAMALLEEGFIFSCTNGVGTVAPSHWLPIVPFAFLVLQLEGETEQFRLPFTRKIAAMAFCGCIVATSVSSVRKFPTTGYVTNPHLETVCGWLVDHGYTQGYSSYWNANVMTEWSSGQIEVWVAPDFKRMDRIYEWLQKTSHENPPEGKIFLLTTDQELEEQKIPELPNVSKVVYEEEEAISKSGRYIIMEYESAEEMMEAIDSVKVEEVFQESQ